MVLDYCRWLIDERRLMLRAPARRPRGRWASVRPSRRLFDDFVVQFDDGLAQGAKYRCSIGRQMVVASASSPSVGVRLTAQPSRALHPFQQRVQRAGADVIAMASKLG